MVLKLSRLILIILLAMFTVGGVRIIQPNHSQTIGIKPVQLDPAHHGQRRLGELVFLSAWQLDSPNEDFGGISGLAALPGDRFIGISDAGTLIGFGLTNDDRIDRPFISPLPETNQPGSSYLDRDSEGITFDAQSGQFWISYEAKHAIRRFSRSFARLDGEVRPKEMQLWPRNKGAETLIRMKDGRFIIVSESLEDDGTHQALLFSGDPIEPGSVKTGFRYRPPSGYRATDGIQMPDGRIMLLHRAVGFPSGFSAKLGIASPPDMADNVHWKSRIIATLSAPLLVDNMEGIAVKQVGKDTIIWLISDSNFNILQRTILMKFRLSERGGNKKPEAIAAPGFESLN
ncbi:esterase-like activity of phytase family protein [Sphingorhabdus sp. IMCC26285]|uniref:Esterase-like activity of phytase family protein n=1 Tax=Sphingorhabdus profundilacus TaxID=2509718 RepID=A0A6I4LTB9_9SPHN|nr:esterase-like activity of phytase family protein [Sphingorhabdus profundilacus]MVZ96672.1 esterase-like activity of phytase family protein [Sphingorhabdus profundilacus]